MDELERLALAVQLPAFEGTTWDADAWRLLEEGLGGVCLFGSNTTGGPDQIAELCGQVRARAEHAVIAIDEEGGDVTRLHYHHGSPVPGNAVLGHLDDPDLTRRAAASIRCSARSARQLVPSLARRRLNVASEHSSCFATSIAAGG